LIVLGDVLNVPVGDLFKAALKPGLVLVGCYVIYVVFVAWLRPASAPAIEEPDIGKSSWEIFFEAGRAIIPPIALVLVVLGSIFTGVATPTESSALGCLGATFLAIIYRKFSIRLLWDSANESVKITAMVFTVLLGASVFSMGFSYTGGEEEIEHLLLGIPGEKWGFLLFIMALITLLGFFLDYIEISYIVLPLVYAVVEELGINLVWFAILVAMNLQTSFLTPPFGFALFYLKGVAPPDFRTVDIYKGVIPFIVIQIGVLATLLIAPELFGLSSEAVSLW
jgi:tripartite ATP-independent transporter DctM subunit